MFDIESANAAVASLEQQLPAIVEALADIPEVLSVRAGFRVRSGVLTNEPVIVVKVRRKTPDLGALIHARFPDVPIDVAPAAPWELYAAAPISKFETAPWQAPPEPEFPGQNHYVPPPNLSLDEVDDEMTIQCHVSPDAGWPTLKPFLAGASETITLAMYEFFQAPHIATVFVDAGRAVDGVAMIIDTTSRSAGVVTSCVQQIGGHCEQEWASTDRQGSIFASAYHTKVLVLDRDRFWLSSGNWKNSGQPNIDPVNKPSDRPAARTRNREWHILVHHPKLAETFEDYIRYDIEQVQQLPQPELAPEAAMPDLFVPIAASPEDAPIPPKFFSPMPELTDRIRIQPLLTPDNYIDHLITLIRRATTSIDIQTQYFSIQKVSGGNLIRILRELQQRRDDGVRIRMIFRDKDFPGDEVDIRKMCEALQANGFAMGTHIRLQHHCHNKGIIVDSRTVVVGSHNWSGDGVTNNRDASLIIHDRLDVADYYGRVFLLDWGRASEVIPEQIEMPEIAAPGAETPPGMVRISWDEYYGE